MESTLSGIGDNLIIYPSVSKKKWKQYFILIFKVGFVVQKRGYKDNDRMLYDGLQLTWRELWHRENQKLEDKKHQVANKLRRMYREAQQGK